MTRSVIILGSEWAGKTIASAMLECSFGKIIGFVDDKTLLSEHGVSLRNGDGEIRFPILGSTEELTNIARQHAADCVVIATRNGNNDQLLKQIIKCYEMGITIYEMPELYADLMKKVPVRHIDDEWIAPKLTAPPHDMYAFFHDATNYLLSILGLICIIPLFPFIGPAVAGLK